MVWKVPIRFVTKESLTASERAASGLRQRQKPGENRAVVYRFSLWREGSWALERPGNRRAGSSRWGTAKAVLGLMKRIQETQRGWEYEREGTVNSQVLEQMEEDAGQTATLRSIQGGWETGSESGGCCTQGSQGQAPPPPPQQPVASTRACPCSLIPRPPVCSLKSVMDTDKYYKPGLSSLRAVVKQNHMNPSPLLKAIFSVKFQTKTVTLYNGSLEVHYTFV